MKAKTLLRLARPRFWIYLLGPFLVGLAANGLFGTSQDIKAILLVLISALYFTLPANLLIYGINDIFDYQSDILNKKKASYETLVKPEDRSSLWTAIALTNIPFLIPFILVAEQSPYSIVAIVGFLFFGIFYSSPPIRAKARPYLDSLFNILYVFPGLYGFLIYNNTVLAIDWRLIIAASLWCIAMHAYSAVPDIQADHGANLRTIATSLGRSKTLWLCLYLYAAAALLSIEKLNWLAYTLGVVYVGLMALSLRTKTDEALFHYYTWFPKINALSGFALFLFIIFNGR